jgi:uncharacterized membrane protein
MPLRTTEEHHPPDGIKSTAAIAGHPIHPMLVPFPIASLVGALVTDIVFMITENPFWAEASRWLLLAGLITGALAAIFGLIDFVTIDKIRQHRAAWIHFLGNSLVMILALVNLFMRPENTVPTTGLVISVIIALILVVTGWLGGELSYRHRIGVLPREEL